MCVYIYIYIYIYEADKSVALLWLSPEAGRKGAEAPGVSRKSESES